MFHIVLVAPEIPPNTGNVIRLAANTSCSLHLNEPLSYSMEDGHKRRAGQDYQAGDWLVFGSESKGLPPEVRAQFPNEQRLRLPMLASQRSLNLSNAVAVTVFEAWRQQGFTGAALAEPAPAP